MRYNSYEIYFTINSDCKSDCAASVSVGLHVAIINNYGPGSCTAERRERKLTAHACWQLLCAVIRLVVLLYT